MGHKHITTGVDVEEQLLCYVYAESGDQTPQTQNLSDRLATSFLLKKMEKLNGLPLKLTSVRRKALQTLFYYYIL